MRVAHDFCTVCFHPRRTAENFIVSDRSNSTTCWLEASVTAAPLQFFLSTRRAAGADLHACCRRVSRLGFF